MGSPITVHCRCYDKDMTDEYRDSDCKDDKCADYQRIAVLSILHSPPHTEVKIKVKRESLQKQRQELAKEPLVWVRCPCGLRLALKKAYRCWFCGITFCCQCAEKHFGNKLLFASEYLGI